MQTLSGPLAKWLFSLLIASTKPGGSVYSFEPALECGTDAVRATCPLTRSCSNDGPLCAAPRWSAVRQAWVRPETREGAARRFVSVANALAETSTRLTGCRDESGSVVEDCKPIAWGGGARGLASALTTLVVWESGGREDIEAGYAPMGRGPDHEACMCQEMPDHIKPYASWLPEGATVEDAVQSVLGEQNLGHCFEVAARMISIRRQNAASMCHGLDPIYAMFSLYGTGSRCSSAGLSVGDFALKRQGTYRKFLSMKPALPDWVEMAIGTPVPTTVATVSEPANPTE